MDNEELRSLVDPNLDEWYLERCGMHPRENQFILKLCSNRVTIGRMDSMTHTLNSPFISKEHAVLLYKKNCWYLEDKSLNGLYVNRRKLPSRGRVQIVKGDVIGFGLPIRKQDEENVFVYKLCQNSDSDMEHKSICDPVLNMPSSSAVNNVKTSRVEDLNENEDLESDCYIVSINHVSEQSADVSKNENHIAKNVTCIKENNFYSNSDSRTNEIINNNKSNLIECKNFNSFNSDSDEEKLNSRTFLLNTLNSNLHEKLNRKSSVDLIKCKCGFFHTKDVDCVLLNNLNKTKPLFSDNLSDTEMSLSLHSENSQTSLSNSERIEQTENLFSSDEDVKIIMKKKCRIIFSDESENELSDSKFGTLVNGSTHFPEINKEDKVANEKNRKLADFNRVNTSAKIDNKKDIVIENGTENQRPKNIQILNNLKEINYSESNNKIKEIINDKKSEIVPLSESSDLCDLSTNIKKEPCTEEKYSLKSDLTLEISKKNDSNLNENNKISPANAEKLEELEINIKTESDNEQSQNGYTQEDEIIIISDDDDDYFKSSQSLNSEVLSSIKCEKNDWSSDEEIEDCCLDKNVEITSDAISIIENGDLTSCLPKETVIDDDDKNKDVFNELENKLEEMKKKLKIYKTENAANTLNDEYLPKEDNDDPFFPILSQSFYSDDDEEPSELLDNDIPKSAQNKSIEEKSQKSKLSGIKLTEALPLSGKHKKKTLSTDPETFYSKIKESTKKVYQKKVEQNHIKKKEKTRNSLNLKDEIKRKLKHRIPIPGGGSAIQTREHGNNKEKTKNFSTILKKISQITESAHNSNLPKSLGQDSAITRKRTTNSRFESRGLFLTEPSHPLKKKKLEVKSFKIPKKSSRELSNLEIKNSAKNHKTEKTANNVLKDTNLKDNKTITVEEKKSDTTKKITSRTSSISRTTTTSTKSSTSTSITTSRTSSTSTNKITIADENTEKLKRKSTKVSDLPAKKVRFADLNETRIIPRNSNPGIKKDSVFPNRNIDGIGPIVKMSATPSINDILYTIISWNPLWLIEQAKNPLPPPVIDYNKLWPTLLSYQSYSDYLRIFQPLLILESWAQITREWETKQELLITCAVAIQEVVFGSDATVQTMNFTCQTLCSPEAMQLQQYPQEGHLVILDVPLTQSFPDSNHTKTVQIIFGYIESVKKSRNHLEIFKSPVLQNHTLVNNRNSCLLSFTIKCKFRKINIDLLKLMRLKVLSYIKPSIRQFQALFFLPRSVLAGDILKPRLRVFNLISNSLLNMKAKGVYNRVQFDAISAITDACSQGISPKICLLQGPPGTGKSHTVIGLIQQLLYGDDMKSKCGMQPKILLTAPSNAAVDELVLRLIKLKHSFGKERRIRFVRIGQMNHIHPFVKEYTLDALLRSNMLQKIQEKNTLESVETELKTLEEKACELQNKIIIHSNQEGRSLQLELTDVKRRISRLRKQKEMSHLSEADMRKEEQQLTWTLLRNADIIATTLSSCRQTQMQTIFANSCVFTACIIDEASQCIEQDTLLPLMFGISKLILIGDPKQLPATVLSQKAQEMGLNQSLFERFYRYFIDNNLTNPILLLNTQYRMHPEICSFPSKCFYAGKLETASLLEMKYSSCPLNPYLLFDVLQGQEIGGKGELFNIQEVEFIIILLDLILKYTCAKLSIGIITPYHAQKRKLKEALQTKFPNHVSNIEVNTVDGFQGKERDIILLSAVRARSSNGSIGFLVQEKRLNVALTRAKQCFYICGHLSSLKVNGYWRALILDAEERRKIISVNSDCDGFLKHSLLKDLS